MNIRVTNILEEHKVDVFIRTLKDNIKCEFHVWEPDSLEKAFKLERKNESKIMAARKPTTHIFKDGGVATPRLPQPTRLTPQKLEEKEQKGFATVVIENTLKVISVLRRNYFT